MSNSISGAFSIAIAVACSALFLYFVDDFALAITGAFGPDAGLLYYLLLGMKWLMASAILWVVQREISRLFRRAP